MTLSNEHLDAIKHKLRCAGVWDDEKIEFHEMLREAVNEIDGLRAEVERLKAEAPACPHEAWETPPHLAGSETRTCADCREYLGGVQCKITPQPPRRAGASPRRARPRALDEKTRRTACIGGTVTSHAAAVETTHQARRPA